MALILYTSLGELPPGTALPKSVEKLKLKCQPPPHHLDYRGKLIAARSDRVFASLDKSREILWKESRKRHLHQLRGCGFQSNIWEPYKELGEVELDNNKLILDSLGQASSQNEDKEPQQEVTSTSLASLASTIPLEAMLSLNEKVHEGNIRLSEMRKGKSLSTVMSREERKKQLQEEAHLKEKSKSKNQWVKASEESSYTPPFQGSAATSLSRLPGVTEGDLMEPTSLSSQAQSRKSSIAADPSLHQSFMSSKRRDSLNSELRPSGSLSPSEKVVDSWLDSKRDETLRKQQIFKEYTVDRWHKKLSVMTWILETMKSEEPYLCNPFPTCLNTNQPQIEPLTAYQAYEDGIHALRQWANFERKASCKGKKRSSGVVQILSTEDLLLPANDLKQVPQSSAMRKLKSEPQPSPSDDLFDVNSAQEEFNAVQKEHTRIVHEQLKVIDRNRTKGAKERISSLTVTGNLHKDLKRMRKGVTGESTEMSRKRLFVNLDWYKELLDSLPPSVKEDIYCKGLLARLERMSLYIFHYTDSMSKNRLLGVLETLDSWELSSPDVDVAIRHIISRVIYIPEQEYETWFKQCGKARTIDDVQAISKEGYKLPVISSQTYKFKL